MAGVRSYENSHSAGRRFPGQMLLKPKSKLMQFNMSYSKGKALFRPWGDLRADGTMAPWRDNDGHFGVSWFIQDDICQAWGKDFKFTAFTRCDDEQNWPTGSPLQLLYDEVRYAPKYKSLTERVGQSWAIIGAPKHCGILKGMVIEMNGKSYAQKPIWGALLVMAPSAKDALDELLNQVAAPSAPAGASADDPYGWNTKYFVGDPIGLTCGKIFEFDKESKIFDAASAEINVGSDGRQSNRSAGDSPIEKYGCRIFPSKPVLPLPLDRVKKYDESFVDALWFMTGEEQINNLIIRAFGHSHREVVLYVFGGKDVLPKTYEFGRVTVDMGAKADAPAAAPAAVVPAAGPDGAAFAINLDADQGGDDEVPFDQDQKPGAGDPPVMTPPNQGFTPPPATVPAVKQPAGGTADSIRARLAAASNKQAQA